MGLCYVGVGFQSNRTQLNTSILHGATAYLTSRTQLLGDTIPLEVKLEVWRQVWTFDIRLGSNIIDNKYSSSVLERERAYNNCESLPNLETMSWSIVKDYLQVDSGVLESMYDEVSKHFPENVRDSIFNAMIGKVSEDNFNALPVLVKLLANDGFHHTNIKNKNHHSSIYGFNNELSIILNSLGFNPQTIVIDMAKRAASSKIVSDKTINFSADGITYTVSEKCDLAQDVRMLITLFLVRGRSNNFYKILKFLGKDAKAAIVLKIRDYSLKSADDVEAATRWQKERVILSPTDITLSRIAASFPHMTLAIAKNLQIDGKAQCPAIKIQGAINNGGKQLDPMPHVLQHGLIPALLSKSQPTEENAIRRFCYVYNLEQTMTLQKPRFKKQMLSGPINTHVENSLKFVDAAINTAAAYGDDEKRSEFLKVLFAGEKAVIDKWIQAGADAWLKASTAATYSSLISTLNTEMNNLIEASEKKAGGSKDEEN